MRTWATLRAIQRAWVAPFTLLVVEPALLPERFAKVLREPTLLKPNVNPHQSSPSSKRKPLSLLRNRPIHDFPAPGTPYTNTSGMAICSGNVVGNPIGTLEGALVGTAVGEAVGSENGVDVGALVGELEGALLGEAVGNVVGSLNNR